MYTQNVIILYSMGLFCRSEWPRSRRLESAAACLLGLRVRIPPEAWVSLESVMFCLEEISATGRSPVQRNPTECGVSEGDLEASIMRTP
jgi:hypothetical protein